MLLISCIHFHLSAHLLHLQRMGKLTKEDIKWKLLRSNTDASVRGKDSSIAITSAMRDGGQMAPRFQRIHRKMFAELTEGLNIAPEHIYLWLQHEIDSETSVKLTRDAETSAGPAAYLIKDLDIRSANHLIIEGNQFADKLRAGVL